MRASYILTAQSMYSIIADILYVLCRHAEMSPSTSYRASRKPNVVLFHYLNQCVCGACKRETRLNDIFSRRNESRNWSAPPKSMSTLHHLLQSSPVDEIGYISASWRNVRFFWLFCRASRMSPPLITTFLNIIFNDDIPTIKRNRGQAAENGMIPASSLRGRLK